MSKNTLGRRVREQRIAPHKEHLNTSPRAGFYLLVSGRGLQRQKCGQRKEAPQKGWGDL